MPPATPYCELCDQHFKTFIGKPKAMATHRSSCLRNSQKPKGVFACSIDDCKYRTNGWDALRHHIKRCKPRAFGCDNCDYLSVNQTNAKAHRDNCSKKLRRALEKKQSIPKKKKQKTVDKPISKCFVHIEAVPMLWPATANMKEVQTYMVPLTETQKLAQLEVDRQRALDETHLTAEEEDFLEAITTMQKKFSGAVADLMEVSDFCFDRLLEPFIMSASMPDPFEGYVRGPPATSTKLPEVWVAVEDNLQAFGKAPTGGKHPRSSATGSGKPLKRYKRRGSKFVPQLGSVDENKETQVETQVEESSSVEPASSSSPSPSDSDSDSSSDSSDSDSD